MKNPSRWVVIGLVALLMAVGVAFYVLPLFDSLHSPPDAPRESAASEMAASLQPVKGSPPSSFAASWRVKTFPPDSSGYRRIEVQRRIAPAKAVFPLGYARVPSPGTEGVILADGTRVALAGFSDALYNPDNEIFELEWEFFTTSAQAQTLHSTFELDRTFGNAAHASDTFGINIHALVSVDPPSPDRQWQVEGFFDLRTGWKLDPGAYSSRQLPEGFLVSTMLRILHETPVGLSLLLAHGSPEQHRLDAKPGAVVETENVRVECLAFEQGVNVGQSAGRGITTLRLQDRPGQSVVVLGIDPPQARPQLILAGVTHDGEAVRFNQSHHSVITVYTGYIDPKEIDHLRVTWLPLRSRLLFDLPPLKSVPEINRGITNLFDVTIPDITIRNEAHFLHATSGLAQVKVHNWASAMEWTPDDLILRDVTVRDLLDEFRARNPRLLLHYNRDELAISVQNNDPPVWLQKLKSWIGLP